MKAILKGHIKQIRRSNDNVEIDILFDGKVDLKIMGDAKEITMDSTLSLKPIVADELKIGSVISVIVTDQEVE